MLSPANMFLLGVVDARPINPYEIVSRFEYNRFNSILNIADSTIYANIRAMHRKGYLHYELQQDGRMPAKKVYSLTEAGRRELVASVRECLGKNNGDLTAFSVALLLMHYFPKEELLELLREHKRLLKAGELAREEEHEFVAQTHKVYPCIPNVSCSRLCYLHAKIEMEVTCMTIDMLEQAEVWPQNTFMLDAQYVEQYQKWESGKS